MTEGDANSSQDNLKNDQGQKNGHGGVRRGSGRKRGSAANLRDAKVAHRLREENTTPLEIMVEHMLTVYRTQGAGAAFPFAEKCAPYMHPKLNAVAVAAGTIPGHGGAGPAGHLEDMSDADLIAIINESESGEAFIDAEVSES